MSLDYDIVVLPFGTGRAKTTLKAGDPRSALAQFARDHGVVGRIEDDAEHGAVLNSDRLVYVAVDRGERHPTLDTRTGRIKS